MKKLIALIAVSLMAVSTTVMADPHYRVTNPDGVELRSRAHGEGSLLCKPPYDSYLHRNKGENYSRWIRVEWKGERWAWDYTSALGGWCAPWERSGWVDKTEGVEPK